MKSQDLQLLQADLQRRSKELDAREEYLNERERFIESGPLDLTVLEETIRAKTVQLEQVKKKIQDKESWYTARINQLQAEVVEQQQKLVELAADIEKSANVVRAAHELDVALVDEHKAVKDEIAERKQYLAEQEKVIAEAIDEGNATLRGINFEIQAALEKKGEATVECAEIETKKTDLAYELVQLEDRFSQDKFATEEELHLLTAQVSEERKKLTATQVEQAALLQEVKEKMHILDTRERELMVKRGALVKDRTELETEKRRWNSMKSLYGIE